MVNREQKSLKRDNWKKTKSSLIAIFLGFLLASLIILFMDENPLLIFYDAFKAAFVNNLQKTLLVIAVLAIASIAHCVAFKTGLFNIGVAGQMFFAGCVSIIIGLNFVSSWGWWGVVLLLLLAIVAGAFLSCIAGFLKAFFNVHEVVSTIFLNWIAFYLMQNYLGQANVTSQSGVSRTLDMTTSLYDPSNINGYIFVGVAIVIAVTIAIMFFGSTFGFRLKTTGLQKDVAESNGINIRKATVSSMLLSGAIAGFAGGVLFVVLYREVPYDYISTSFLPLEGFTSIAIALLAFSNPLATIPVACLFGALQEGTTSFTNEGVRNISDLIIGIVVYFAAISVLFQRFEVAKLSLNYFKYLKSQDRKKLKNNLKKQMNVLLWKSKGKDQNQVVIKKQKLLIKKDHNKQLREVRKKFLKPELQTNKKREKKNA